MRELLDRDAEELLGTEVWEAFPEARGSTFQREYERAMTEQEPVTFEEFYPRWTPGSRCARALGVRPVGLLPRRHGARPQ